jgi:sec-independent protein translocase protein TatA
MPANLGGWTGLILLLVVILLFAAPKLPQLARSLGQSMTIFKKEIKNKDADATATAESTAAPAAEQAPAAPAASTEGTDSSSTK